MGGNQQRRSLGPLAAQAMKGFERIQEMKENIKETAMVANNQGAVLSAIMSLLVQKGVVTQEEMTTAVALSKQVMLGGRERSPAVSGGKKENRDGTEKSSEAEQGTPQGAANGESPVLPQPPQG